jgi:cAMP-dependent protein kinase regulator
LQVDRDAPEDFLPEGFRRGRKRGAISGAAVNVEELRAYQPTLTEKSPAVKARLSQIFKEMVLFKMLSQHDLDQVIGAITQRETKASECVIRQGEAGYTFYVVESGLFDVYVNGVHVAEYDEKGSFGELALIHNCARAATVMSVSSGTVWCLDVGDWILLSISMM